VFLGKFEHAQDRLAVTHPDLVADGAVDALTPAELFDEGLPRLLAELDAVLEDLDRIRTHELAVARGDLGCKPWTGQRLDAPATEVVPLGRA
jgi:hypothetical protein